MRRFDCAADAQSRRAKNINKNTNETRENPPLDIRKSTKYHRDKILYWVNAARIYYILDDDNIHAACMPTTKPHTRGH